MSVEALVVSSSSESKTMTSTSSSGDLDCSCPFVSLSLFLGPKSSEGIGGMFLVDTGGLSELVKFVSGVAIVNTGGVQFSIVCFDLGVSGSGLLAS